jgi:hypothetical protein
LGSSAFDERQWLSDDNIIDLVRYSPSNDGIKIADNSELRYAMVNDRGLTGDTSALRRLLIPCNTSDPAMSGGNHWVVYSCDIHKKIVVVTRYNSFGTHEIERDADIHRVVQRTFPDKIVEIVAGICARQNDGWSCGHRCVRMIRALLLDQPIPLMHSYDDSLSIARELK